MPFQWGKVCSVVMLVAGFTLPVGCEDAASQPDPPIEQWLQADTTRLATPNGTMKPETIQDVGGGIQFETEDGKTWTAPYQADGEGGFTLGEFQAVQPPR